MRQHSLFPEPSEGEKPAPPLNSRADVPVHHEWELAFDVEATGRDPFSDSLVGIALCREKGSAFYVPLRHVAGPNLPDALELLRPVLQDESVFKIGHNLKYDILILRREGIGVAGRLYDTMIASYLLNPNKPGHSLEETALDHLQHKKRPFSEVLGNRVSFAVVPVEEATRYAAEDALLAFELKEILFALLRDRGLHSLYFDVEMPLISVLCDMEEAGVRVDAGRLRELSKELEQSLALLEQRIYALAGGEFNINSPKQLASVLFERLGLKPLKKTKTGYSTSVEILEELAGSHELPGEILNYRTLFKLKSTYVDTLPKLINARSGRIHTSFNQAATATGRLSSSEPNLQNIPIRGEWGTRIRNVFIAADGFQLLSADYSQVELRVLAHMSGDRTLTEAFLADVDIHTRTASELFGIAPDSVTADMRRIAKTVNFGVIYGISPFGLSEALKIPQKEAGAYIERYFASHSGVKTFVEETLARARQDGFVTTLLGRKRPLPEINSANPSVRQQAERMAVNTPIQGTAADLIKLAMLSISRRLKEQGFRARMVLQIHDELLFELPEEELPVARNLITYEMEHALKLSVPLKVDTGTGKSWAEAH
jgi:DNA polymerase-1